MSHYILLDDITDKLVIGLDNSNDLEDYLDLADIQLIDLAERRGIRDTDELELNTDNTIKHEYIQRYLVNWLCMRWCMDRIGATGTDITQNEIYSTKYHMYKSEVDKIEDGITYEMLTGEVDEIGDRSITSGLIFRS